MTVTSTSWSRQEQRVAEVELALAVSARPWVDSLHRFLADHGGARVRTVVMGPEDVMAEEYDVLIIDDVCSFLTPRLVEQARRLGRQVVGVFDDRDGPDAKQRLLECGVDDVIEGGASPEEFVSVVNGVLELAPFVPPTSAGLPSTDAGGGRVVVITGPPGGCGATEVSLAVARHAGQAVLLDADDVAPSVAQRIGLPLTPNLRTAIDIVYHRSGELADTVFRWDRVDVVAGLGDPEAWSQLRPGEVEAVVDELASRYRTVVVNAGSGIEPPQLGEGRFGLSRSMVRRADALVGVGRSDPVSLSRLVRWAAEASRIAPDTPLVLALNRVPRSSYRRSEVRGELSRILPAVPIVVLPEDKRVEEAAWAGAPVAKGPFLRAIAKLVEEVGL